MDISKREEAVAYLVVRATYPMWSKAGAWFRDADGGRVEEPQRVAIVEALDLVNKETCDAVRKEVRARVSAERTYISIKDWAVEERPREQLAKRGADSMSNARLLAILFRTGRSFSTTGQTSLTTQPPPPGSFRGPARAVPSR